MTWANFAAVVAAIAAVVTVGLMAGQLYRLRRTIEVSVVVSEMTHFCDLLGIAMDHPEMAVELYSPVAECSPEEVRTLAFADMMLSHYDTYLRLTDTLPREMRPYIRRWVGHGLFKMPRLLELVETRDSTWSPELREIAAIVRKHAQVREGGDVL